MYAWILSNESEWSLRIDMERRFFSFVFFSLEYFFFVYCALKMFFHRYRFLISNVTNQIFINQMHFKISDVTVYINKFYASTEHTLQLLCRYSIKNFKLWESSSNSHTAYSINFGRGAVLWHWFYPESLLQKTIN